MKAFKDIHNYKLMVQWLERIDDDDAEPSDIDVWHLQKTQYTFKDFGVWKQEGTLDKEYQMQQKEKGKAKARMSQRKEKRRMVEPKEGGDEPRKEKSSSGGKSKVMKASTSKSRK